LTQPYDSIIILPDKEVDKSLVDLADFKSGDGRKCHPKNAGVLGGPDRRRERTRDRKTWKWTGHWWASRTSNPVMGANNVHGGFDSHALPPVYFL
jgi:hypothetical protein